MLAIIISTIIGMIVVIIIASIGLGLAGVSALPGIFVGSLARVQGQVAVTQRQIDKAPEAPAVVRAGDKSVGSRVPAMEVVLDEGVRVTEAALTAEQKDIKVMVGLVRNRFYELLTKRYLLQSDYAIKMAVAFATESRLSHVAFVESDGVHSEFDDDLMPEAGGVMQLAAYEIVQALHKGHGAAEIAEAIGSSPVIQVDWHKDLG
jgi:hypothetical protein